MISAYTRSVAAEGRKLFSTAIWWVLALVLFGYVAMMSAFLAFFFSDLGSLLGGTAAGAGGTGLDAAAAAGIVYSTATSIGYVMPVLLGALAVTGEYRYRTLAATFTAQPRRGVVLLAKAKVLLLAGLGYGVVGAAAVVLVGGGTIALTGGDPMLGKPETWALLLRVVLAMGFWGLIGVGLGALLRSQAVAIVLVLAFTQFLEPILRLTASFWEVSAEVARFLPGAATDALVGTGLYSNLGALDPSLGSSSSVSLGVWAGGLVLAGYGVLVLLLAWLLRWRNDLE